MAARSTSERNDWASLVPGEFRGWTIEEDQIFSAETIFDYIDGAGEVYRSYNMRSLFARCFVRPGKPALVVDLFDMGTADDAFGVFTHDLEGEEAGLGQGSTYKGGLLSFWKGRYFASIYAEEETPETKQAVHGLGREIDGTIVDLGQKPDLISALPPEGLVERSVRFFHNHIVLNYHFFVADENILRLDQTTSAVLAPYGEKDERIWLLLVRYSEVRKAAEALESFVRAYMPDAGDKRIVQTEDGKWTAARRKDNLIIIAFEASSRSKAEYLLENVKART